MVQIKTKGLCRGLTLIEMMLVIAVMAAMAIIGVRFLKSNWDSQRITQTANDIRQIQQAAISLHSRGGSWPTTENDFLTSFVSQEDFCSPYKGTGSSPCSNKAKYKIVPFPSGLNAETASSFGLQLTLPDEETAQRLASLLSHAKVTGSTVTTYISAGAFAKNVVKRGWIASMGLNIDKDWIQMPQCGDGFEGHIIRSPESFVTDYDFVRSGFLKKTMVYFMINYVFSLPPVQDATGKNPSFKFQLQLYDNIVGGQKNQTWFFTFCIPDGAWQADPKFFGENISQCTSPWTKEYNTGSGQKC